MRAGTRFGLVMLAVSVSSCAANPGLPTQTSATTTPDSTSTASDSDCPSLGESPGAPGLDDPVFPLLGNGGYDVLHYRLQLSIDPGRNHLAAAVTIEALATQGLTAFNLDFAGPEVDQVMVDEETAPFCRVGGELVVVPAHPIADEEEFEVLVSYAGSPEPLVRPGAPGPEGWVHISEERIVAGGLWGAETAFLSVNATNRDKATFFMEISVPKPLGVAATGRLVEVVDNEESTTYVWASEVPTPTSRILITTGRFEQESLEGPGGLLIQYQMPPESPPDLRADLEKTATIIEALTPLLGPFPFETLGFTSVPDSPETTAISGQNRILILGLDRLGDRDLAHEIGHQWFGNSVTPATSQDDWLSEGLATFVESLWLEANLGSFQRDVLPRIWLGRLRDETRPLGIVDSPEQLGDFVTYLRGGATLHALRLEVGDESFFGILQQYVSRFRHASAATEDFVEIAEEVSGRDLTDFFETWLYEETVPEIPGLGS